MRPTQLGLLLGVVVFSLFAASAAGRTPFVMTQRDSGKTFVVPRGTTPILRLTHRFRWTAPHLSSDVVTLVRVDYESDPGFTEWRLDRNRAGAVTVRSRGLPRCRTCESPIRRFYVRLRVR